MIPLGMIESWKSQAPWTNDVFVEQDLILSRLLISLYADEKVKKALIFKGGTALHKLFFKKALRYSEDLDFDQHTSEPIGDLISTIRNIASDIFDNDAKYDRHEQMFILRYRYRAESPPNPIMKVKIEINTRKHNSYKPLQQINHHCDSTWFSGESSIITYKTEELLASKLKALYQRNKGRDLFDLKIAEILAPDFKEINLLFQKMLLAENLKVDNKTFISNLQEKVLSNKFRNDILPLIPKDFDYSIDEAANFVIQNYFLKHSNCISD